jgi:hypothetical protein
MEEIFCNYVGKISPLIIHTPVLNGSVHIYPQVFAIPLGFFCFSPQNPVPQVMFRIEKKNHCKVSTFLISADLENVSLFVDFANSSYFLPTLKSIKRDLKFSGMVLRILKILTSL